MRGRGKKEKKQYPEDMRSLLGFSLPGLSIAFSTVIYGLFMQYLTDYSGIDNAIGKAGYAVTFGTIFLVVSRIVDGVDDPLQAWIMDSMKESRFGKYRKATLIGILLIFIGMVAMFAIPDGVKSSRVGLWIWVLLAYLLYDMGTALNGITAILQKATTELAARSKIMTWHRMFLIIGAIPATFFVPIATAINARFNDMGKSVSVTCIFVTGISTILSLIGIALIRERYLPQTEEISAEERESKADGDKGSESVKVTGREILMMLKTNKAMWIHNIAYVIGNSAYGFSSAMLVYFLKWYYCAQTSTGVVDNAKYAALTGVNSTFGIVSALVAPLAANWFTKKIGTIDKSARTCMITSGIGYVVLFVLYLTGVFSVSPMIYIVLNFIIGLPTSMATIPFLLLNVEVCDYSEYKTERNMTALTNSVSGIISKGSTALTTAINGALLIAFGYSVDSVTGNFSGDVSHIVPMINSMAMFITIIPAILCIACYLIYRFAYPITPKVREEMTAELNARHAGQNHKATVEA